MKKFSTKSELQQYLNGERTAGKKVGLVPTMGALHDGHLSLIRIAQQQCDMVVCTIFVNPTQFNDPKDLEKYPRPIASDIEKLEGVGCDILFNPEVNEMYASHENWHLNIGELESLLEGAARPGHYQGVTQVVSKLFTIVEPDTAFFGQKDYQQFLVISKMIELLQMPVNLVMCPIQREADGLAMSSRNVHLSASDRQHALVLSQTLNSVKENYVTDNITGIKQTAQQIIETEPNVELSYFEIANAETLQPALPETEHVIALVAANVGNTRLIDNVIIR